MKASGPVEGSGWLRGGPPWGVTKNVTRPRKGRLD